MQHIFLLLAIGVYPEIPDYIINGIPVYLEGAKENDLDIARAIRYTEDMMAERMGKEWSIIHKRLLEAEVSIYVKQMKYSKPGQCPNINNKEKRCYGFECRAGDYGWCVGAFTAFVNKIEYVPYDCIADSALAHELIHAILFTTDKTLDRKHIMFNMFKDACKKLVQSEKARCISKTTEGKINAKLRKHCK